MKPILVLALTLVVAIQAPGAVNGVVKDTQGAPVAGALVVAEGTNEAAITDAAGKFQLGPIQSGVLRSALAPRLQEAGLRVDAQGRIQRISEAGSRKAYYRVPAVSSKGGTSPMASKRSAADIDLLVSQGSHFGTQMPVNPASSVPVEVPLELIAEFAKLNKVEREVGDIQVLEFTDSTILGVDGASKDNPVCKDGKVVLLPDTLLMAYKIIGKTLYQWSPEDVDSDEPVAALFTSATGTKFGTWNYVGFGQAPVALPDGITQGGMDSLLAMQAKALRISGTSVLGDKSIRNDVQAGFCLGPLLAGALGGGGMLPGSLVGVPKNCNEVALTNGTESATLSFVSTRDSVTTTFVYKGSTCVETSPASLDPAYDCEGQPDGHVPEDTSDGDLTGLGGLSECQAFTTFLLGGIVIPGLPKASIEGPGLPGGLPAIKPGLSTRVPNLSGWAGVNPLKFVVLPGSGTGRKAVSRTGTWVR